MSANFLEKEGREGESVGITMFTILVN